MLKKLDFKKKTEETERDDHYKSKWSDAFAEWKWKRPWH
jgi:hypothetical protein